MTFGQQTKEDYKKVDENNSKSNLYQCLVNDSPTASVWRVHSGTEGQCLSYIPTQSDPLYGFHSDEKWQGFNLHRIALCLQLS